MSNWAERIRNEVGKAVIGQETIVERMLVALLADGHVLLEGMPGLAKMAIADPVSRTALHGINKSHSEK